MDVQKFELKGIITAPLTPFRPNGDVDYGKFKAYADHISDYQNTCVFANGTTGEGLSMTLDERKKAAEEWVKVSQGRFQLIINVSAANLRDAAGLAQHAELIGADAISAHTPLFYTPNTVEALVDCMKVIAQAASKTPFYYYDINFQTGINFDNGEVFKMAVERIPTFRGMKQSSREIAYLVTSVMGSQNHKFQVITGNELLLAGLPLGVRIPVCLPFAGRIFTRMVEAFDRNDMVAAFKEQENAQLIQYILKKYGPGAKKAMSTLIGMDVGPSRLPVKDLTEAELVRMKADMDELGIFDRL